MAGAQQFTGRVPSVHSAVVAGGDWSLYLPGGLAGRSCQYFAYELDFLPLGASASTTSSVQVQNDSDFVCLSIFADVRSSDNATTLAFPQWPFTISLQDTGAGRNLQSAAVPLSNIAAPNQFGQRGLVQPNFFAASSTISATLTNLTATAQNIRLTFAGVKVYGF